MGVKIQFNRYSFRGAMLLPLVAGMLVAAGCSSKPPLPERQVKTAPAFVGTVAPNTAVAPASVAVPAVPTTVVVPTPTSPQVAPVTYVEPAPIGPLLKPMPAPAIDPAIKPYDEWTDQEIAADALGRIGPTAVPALRQALVHEDPAVRAQAASVLARMGSDAKDAVPDLVRLLDDPNVEVRRAATRTLGRIGPAAADAVPSLMKTLLTPE